MGTVPQENNTKTGEKSSEGEIYDDDENLVFVEAFTDQIYRNTLSFSKSFI